MTLPVPDGWVVTSLGEAIEPRRIRMSPSAWPDARFLGLEHIEAHTMRILGNADAGSMKSSAAVFEPGDVLYSRLRPYLNKVVRPDFEGLCSAEFIVLPDTPHLRSEFLRYRLNAADFVSFASHLDEGDRPRVDFNQLGAFRLLIPPVPEHHRLVAKIEELFSDLDAGVAALRRARVELKRYRASVLKAAVEGRLTAAWRAAHPDVEPAEKLLERILTERRAKWEAEQLRKYAEKGKEPPKGWKQKYPDPAAPVLPKDVGVPSTWTEASLEQLTSATRVICYGILMPKDHIPDGVPFVKVRDMRGDRLDPAALQRTSPEIAAKYARASLLPGDLLLAIRGTYGRTVEVPAELIGANITQDTARLAVSPLIDRAFVLRHLRSMDSQNYFKRVARGVAVKGVNIGDVRPAPILLPPNEEQAEIVAEVDRRLSVVDAVEAEVEHALQRAGRLRQSILKRAFEGGLVPQDPSDEPAEQLLERLRAEGGDDAREATTKQSTIKKRGRKQARA